MPPYCAVASSSRLIRDARNTATPALMDYGFPMGGRFVRQLVPEQRALQVAHPTFPRAADHAAVASVQLAVLVNLGLSSANAARVA